MPWRMSCESIFSSYLNTAYFQDILQYYIESRKDYILMLELRLSDPSKAKIYFK